jgi:hypothetical protein
MDNKGIGAILGGFLMTRKRILIALMARVLLTFCILVACAYALPLPGQPFISASSLGQFPNETRLSAANGYVASDTQGLAGLRILGASAPRSVGKGDALDDGAVKAGSPEMNPSPEPNPATTIERKVRDAQLTILATVITVDSFVKEDRFQVPPGETVTWEVELVAYNMRASTGWRYWDARLEFGSELSVEAPDGPGTIDPIPEGGSPTESTLAIMRDEKTRKTKVAWSWHSLEDNTSSDFPKRAKATIRLRVCLSQESGYRQGSYIFCDNAVITYMTGAKRPKETTCELAPIVVNVTSL